jgi:DNA-binding CsgD family transcriptional regulator
LDSALFAEEHLQLLLEIGRAASTGVSFQERMGAVAPLVQRLVPGRASASVRDVGASAGDAAWSFGPQPDAHPTHDEANGAPVVHSDGANGHRLLCAHRMPDGALFAFTLQRGPEQPSFDGREQALLALCSPDLARAVTGLVLQRALQANASTPGSSSGVHGVAFDRDGRVVHADLGSSLLLDEDALRRLGEEVAARALAKHPQLGAIIPLSVQLNGGSALPVRLLTLDAQSGVAALALLSHEAADSRFERLVRETRLTARERQVAALAIDGLRNRDIAERLGVGVDTIKWHLKTIFLKTKVRGRGGLAAIVLGRT